MKDGRFAVLGLQGPKELCRSTFKPLIDGIAVPSSEFMLGDQSLLLKICKDRVDRPLGDPHLFGYRSDAYLGVLVQDVENPGMIGEQVLQLF